MHADEFSRLQRAFLFSAGRVQLPPACLQINMARNNFTRSNARLEYSKLLQIKMCLHQYLQLPAAGQAEAARLIAGNTVVLQHRLGAGEFIAPRNQVILYAAAGYRAYDNAVITYCHE